MVDRAVIGKESAPGKITLKADSMREFAKAVGETDPVYFDSAAARAAGYHDIIATPTYPIAFMAEAMDPDLFFELGLDIPSIVHGEQEFEYFGPMVAGDELSVTGRIADVWEKQGSTGLLDFVVLEASAKRASGEPVYVSRITLIARRAEPEEDES
jgi:acyl dehydratase